MAAALLAGCGSLDGPTPAPSSTPAASTTGSPSPTSAATAGSFILATLTGGVFRSDPGTKAVQVAKPCSELLRGFVASPNGRLALATCADFAETQSSGFLLTLDQSVSPKALPLKPLARAGVAAWASDNRTLAFEERVPSAPSAPVLGRLIEYDTTSGASKELRPPEFAVSAVRWTPLGLSIFLPQGSAAGLPGAYLWDGAKWQRYGERALIAADAGGRALLESNEGSWRGVWERQGADERLVSGRGYDELALFLLDNGRVVTWRPPAGPDTGIVFVYRGGGELRRFVSPDADCGAALMVGSVLWCGLRGQRLTSFDLDSGATSVRDPQLPPSFGGLVAIAPVPHS